MHAIYGNFGQYRMPETPDFSSRDDALEYARTWWPDNRYLVVREVNVWGTDKSLINADEFCVDCEHSVPGHFTNCPFYRTAV